MDVIIATHGAIASLALGWWLQRRALRGLFLGAPPLWLRPVSLQLYAALERARRELFRDGRTVRFTILVPDRVDPARLRPALRLGWGRAAPRSQASFRRGEGLAGRAWELGSVWLVARLPPAAGIERRRALHAELFALGAEAAGRLSERQLRADVLLAGCVTDSSGSVRGVLCIDCLDGALVPDAQHPDAAALAWYRRLQRLAVDVGLLLEPLHLPGGRPGSSTRTLEQSSDRSASLAALRVTDVLPAR